MPLQHFIVEGKHLGTVDRTFVHTHEQVHFPNSYAFFCKHCGEIWARCPVEATGGTFRPFMLWQITCRKCFPKRHSLEIPGSLLLSWDRTFDTFFPEAVWHWELQRHLGLFPATD